MTEAFDTRGEVVRINGCWVFVKVPELGIRAVPKEWVNVVPGEKDFKRAE